MPETTVNTTYTPPRWLIRGAWAADALSAATAVLGGVLVYRDPWPISNNTLGVAAFAALFFAVARYLRYELGRRLADYTVAVSSRPTVPEAGPWEEYVDEIGDVIGAMAERYYGNGQPPPNLEEQLARLGGRVEAIPVRWVEKAIANARHLAEYTWRLDNAARSVLDDAEGLSRAAHMAALAVLVRDLITPGDFVLMTGPWAAEGLPIPGGPIPRTGGWSVFTEFPTGEPDRWEIYGGAPELVEPYSGASARQVASQLGEQAERMDTAGAGEPMPPIWRLRVEQPGYPQYTGLHYHIGAVPADPWCPTCRTGCSKCRACGDGACPCAPVVEDVHAEATS